MIPHNRPLILLEDQEAVSRTLNSGWIAQGPEVESLEADFVRYYSSGAAAACSSGTSALFLALESLNIGTGQRVAVPSYACSALLNAVNMTGATPVVCDISLDSFCLAPQSMPDVDAAIAVHTYGAKADIKGIYKHAPIVIEDCCQSLGGTYEGTPLGSQGDAAVFSFYATKIITSGNGGMIWSKDKETIHAVKDYTDFDCRRSYRPRFNFLMSDIQAAMVRSQFRRLESIVARRHAIASRYIAAINNKIPTQSGLDADGRMAYRFVLRFKSEQQRRNMQEAMLSADVQTAIPIEEWELLHRYLDLDKDLFPNTEKLAKTTLSLPIHLGLTDDDVEHISNILKQELS